MAAPDFSPITSAIEGALMPIAAVGSAVLLILVAQWVMRVVRAPLQDDLLEEAFHEEFMMTVCPMCGGHSQETDDPEIESGLYCTECGYDGSTPLEGTPTEVDEWDRYESETYECAMCGARVDLDNDTCESCGNQEVPY